jgi:hypothetical protein
LFTQPVENEPFFEDILSREIEVGGYNLSDDLIASHSEFLFPPKRCFKILIIEIY